MNNICPDDAGSELPPRLRFRLHAVGGILRIATDGYLFATIHTGMNDRETCAEQIARLWNAEQDRLYSKGAPQ